MKHFPARRAVLALGAMKKGEPSVKLVGFEAPGDSRRLLERLVHVYRRASRSPLPLLPRASWRFADEMRVVASDPSFFDDGLPTDHDALAIVARAHAAALAAWRSTPNRDGDESDPYLARVYEGTHPIVDETIRPVPLALDFARLALTVWGPVMHARRAEDDAQAWLAGGVR